MEDKNAILVELNNAKTQLQNFRDRLKQLENKYDILVQFGTEYNNHVRSFEESMSRRRNRLSGFDSILSKVKSALRYKEKMSDMLYGAEYSNAVAAIDNMQTSLSTEKRTVTNDISYVEGQIRTLEAKVTNLQYQYDNYVGEESADE